MATIYRCDRCKKDTTRNDEIERITIPEITRAYKLVSEQHYDLCSQCIDELVIFLRPLTSNK